MKLLLVTLPLLLLPNVIMLAVLGLCSDHANAGVLKIIAVITFVATIVSALAIYFVFIRLSRPVYLVRKAINKYTAFRTLPSLPLDKTDETGMLLHDVQKALEHIDSLLTEKSDMIDLLSHDLRSPVTRILGLSNVIKLDENPETMEYADMITTECRNLLTMMENILLMFREDTMVFAPQNVNLLTLANETVHFFSLASAQKKLDLRVDIDEHLFVNVQQGLFTQAMRNILGNAIKFSSEGKAIFISAKQVEHEVSITIRDEGIGLNQQELVRIFERFTASGRKGTHGETSIGLGLYLCKKIIEKQGGKVTAQSEGAGKGAVFVITLYQLITKKRKSDLPTGDTAKTKKSLRAPQS